MENTPQKGPLLVVANHPATFLDPIVIGVHLKLRTYFLGKAVIFNSPLAAKFFRYFNVIPVYRSEDDPSLMGKNEETFKASYEHLEKGGVLMIFPEGYSQSVRKLQKIKTGTARIALGAEFQNNFGLNVKILPIGLNYSNQEKFQSKLFISIGEPIRVKDFENIYKEDQVVAVRKLTEEIESRLDRQTINAGNERFDSLVIRIEKLMKARVLKDWGGPKDELEKEHVITKGITDAVHYFEEKDPVRFSKMEQEINEFFEVLKDIDLPETIFESRRLSAGAVFLYLGYFLAGLPFFVLGFINNIIPYELSFLIARLSTGLKEFRGAIGFAAGTFIFLFFYSLEFIFADWIFNDWLIPLIGIVATPFLGIFAFYYWKKVKRFYYKVVFSFAKKRFFIQNLLAKRSHIIRELEAAQQEFLKKDRMS